MGILWQSEGHISRTVISESSKIKLSLPLMPSIRGIKSLFIDIYRIMAVLKVKTDVIARIRV